MKDVRLRGRLLRAFYEQRDALHGYKPRPADFDGQLTQPQIYRLCKQFRDRGLIEGNVTPSYEGDGSGVVIAKITSLGIRVVEGRAHSPVAIRLDTVDASKERNDASRALNRQTVVNCIAQLTRMIDALDAAATEKTEAKEILLKFLAHPLLVKVVAGPVGDLASSEGENS